MKNKYLIWFLFIAVLVSACKQKQNITTKKMANKKNLPTLLQSMEESEFKPQWFSVKASIDFSRNDESTGFKANIRMKKDSMIWMSITPLIGVELGRVLFTPDTIKVINRIDGTYFIGNYDYLNQKFDTEVDYNVIQALLLGNSLSLEENEKLVASIDQGMYLLSGLKKRKLRRSLEKDDPKTNSDRVYSAWIDPVTFKITKQSFADFESSHFLEVQYSEFESIENLLFPTNTSISLESTDTVKTTINYSNLVVNQEKKMPFTISSKYEPIKL